MAPLSITSRPASSPLPAVAGAHGRRALAEAWLYLTGSGLSRRRQEEELATLDAHLRRDIGLPPRRLPACDPWTGPGMPGW